MHELSIRRWGLLGLAFLVLAAVLVSRSLAKSGATVRLDPIALRLERGQTGEVAIRVEGVADLAGAEVHLVYDSDVVEVVDADPEEDGVQIAHGGFLPADFVAQNQASDGRIDYAVARMPPHEPVSGDGDLAILTVKGRKKGEGTVAIRSVILADPDGRPIPFDVITDPTLLTVDSSPGLPVCGLVSALMAAAIGLGLIVGLKRSFAQGREVV